MEGKATFTLTEAKTGRTVKQFTEHNLITDAVKRILNPPIYTIMNNFNYSDFMKCMLPLSQTLFGGIILLGNNVEESKSNVMLGKDSIPIATAGGAYAGTNVMRGTLNENESYATANGYHYTWDFGTDKANGTIKCVALTSRQFGNTGFTDEDKSGILMLNPVNTSTSQASTVQYFYAKGQYVGTFEKLTHTYFKVNSSDNRIEFMRYKSNDPDAVGINDTVSLSEKAQPISTTTVTLPINYSTACRWFLDTTARVIYFFSTAYAESDKFRLDYAGVSMDDFSIADTGSFYIPNKYSAQRAAAIYDGKLVIAGDNRIDVFSGSGVLLTSYDIYESVATLFFTVNGVLYFVNGNALTLTYYNGSFYRAYNNNSISYMYSVDILPPYFPSTFADSALVSESLSRNPALGLAANILSTINNLSEPLEKTSEHTLKITYDITC